VIDDKTFGLKNKNKSKIVQKFVQEVLLPPRASNLSEELEYAKGFLFFLQPERIVLNHHARRSWSRLFREGFL
jgi:hypothetical protein